MYKVAIIMPYFGIFPNYFDIWLATAGKNHSFDFLIMTDSDMSSFNIPDNVKIIKMTLNEIRDRAIREVGFKVSLDSAYKLCDYKPAYGAIFEDLLTEYTHWGHCDSDVVFGNLSKFITDERLSTYDRIYDLGHLCVYKNNKENNRRWKMIDNLYTYNYKEVFRVKHCKMFDERGGMWDIWKQSGASEFIDRTEIADIFVNPYQFTTWYSKDKQWYEYSDGCLLGHFIDEKSGEEREKEFAYIHLQKRRMKNKGISFDQFVISPNSFSQVLELSSERSETPTVGVAATRGNSKLKKIMGALKKDELIFHIRVALRRMKYWITGKNRGIRYKYF